MARRPKSRSGPSLEQLGEKLKKLREIDKLPASARRRLNQILEDIEELKESLSAGGDIGLRDGERDRPKLRPVDISETVTTIEIQPDLPSRLALEQVTSAAIEAVRVRVPDALPARPLPTGDKGTDLPITSAALTRLVQLAAVARSQGEDSVIWDDGVSQLIVHASQLKAAVSEGLIRISIPVAADRLKSTMRVPFAVGSEKRLAGLAAATALRPAGDADVARIWGDALIALAYGALMDAIDSLAGASGRDVKNDRLIPRALVAGRGQLTIESQAKFRFRGQTR